MAEIGPRQYIFGIFAFTFIIVGTVYLMAEFRADKPDFGYTTGPDGSVTDQYEAFNTSFNKMDDVIRETADMNETIEGLQSNNWGLLGVLDTLIGGAWNAIRTLGTSWSFMTAAIGATTDVFGIPSWIPNLAISAIVIIIVFGVLAIIFQRDL